MPAVAAPADRAAAVGALAGAQCGYLLGRKAFGLLTVTVIGDGKPLYGDEDLTSWSVSHRPDVAVALARGLTATGTGTGTGVIPYVLARLTTANLFVFLDVNCPCAR